MVNTRNKLIQCPVCILGFVNKKSLDNHLKIHKDDKRHTCNDCGKTFSRPGNLKKHAATHTYNKVKCAKCDHEFANELELKQHTVTHTLTEAKDVPLPNISIQSPGQTGQFICTVCAKHFNDLISLRKHKFVHTINQTHVCAICSEGFESWTQLSAHIDAHEEEDRYTCTRCGISFGNSQEQSKHFLFHAANGFCNSTNVSTLARKKPQPTPDAVFKCLQCFELFPDANQLVKHDRLHRTNHETKTIGSITELPIEPKLEFSTEATPELNTKPTSEPTPDPTTELTTHPTNELNRETEHTTMSTMKPYNCIHCHMSFIHPDENLKHQMFYAKNGFCVNNNQDKDSNMEVTAEETPNTLYQCSLCDDVFNSDSERDRHTLQNHTTYIHKSEDITIDSASGIQSTTKTNVYVLPAVQKRAITYKCSQCSMEFKDAASLTTHSLGHDGIMANLCRICGETFRTCEVLRQHYLTHTVENCNTCAICGKRFTLLRNLMKHVQSHAVMFSCFVCGDKFQDASSYKEHSPNHALVKYNAKVKLYICGLCEKEFSDLISASAHKALHSVIKPHVCIVCTKEFLSWSSLKAHTDAHASGVPYACHTCDVIFKTHAGQQAHLSRHGEHNKYVCYVCAQWFETDGILNLHLESTGHTVKNAYKCTYCGIKFSHLVSLTKHLTVHIGKENSDLCSRADEDIPAGPLEEKNTMQTEVKCDVCLICDTSFSSSEVLQKHMVVHAGENLSCAKCDTEFTDVTAYNRHALAHTLTESRADEKLFICMPCGLACKDFASLNSHIAMHNEKKQAASDEQSLTSTANK